MAISSILAVYKNKVPKGKCVDGSLNKGNCFIDHINSLTLRFIEKKLSLLKVQGEIKELLKYTDTCSYSRNRQDILVNI